VAITPRGERVARFCPRCGWRLEPLEGDASGPAVPVRPELCGAAVTSFVLGLLGLCVPGCAPAGLAAIFVGAHAQSRIERSPQTLRGGGLAVAGMVLGAIGGALWLAVCVALL